MSQGEISAGPPDKNASGRLFSLYERYVGEPESITDVYGYWTFIAGALVGIGGVIAFVVGWTTVPGFDDSQLWALTSAIAAVGLPVALFGLVLLLPVRRRGMEAAMGGMALSVVGALVYVWAYPTYWRYGDEAGAYTIGIIAVYTAGVATIAAIAALIPVITGREARFVEEELEENRDDPPILTGKASRGALFSVYPTAAGEWTWRAIRQEAMAHSLTEASARTEAKDAVETVRAKVGQAGLLEIATTSFRLYEDEQGRWRWSLLRDDGSVIAESAERLPGRDDADATVSFTKEHAPTAPTIDIENAAVDTYRDGGRWRWRLLDENRTVLAEGVTDHDERDEAESAFERAGELTDDARILAIDELAAELRNDGDEWRWRLLNADDEEIAESATGFGARRAAESAAENALERTANATVLDRGQSRYEAHPDGDDWAFRLLDDGDEIVARNGREHADRADSRADAARMAETADDADTVEIDAAAYEIYPAALATDGGKADGDRADSDAADADAADAEAADGDPDWLDAESESAASDDIDGESDPTADDIEIEGEPDAGGDDAEREAAAPEHETSAAGSDADDSGDGRRWHWRFVGEDRTVVAERTEGYATPDAAREAIETVRQQAMEAELIEFDTAAFQQYEDEQGNWRWRLIDEDGNVMADSGQSYDSKSDASSAMVTLKETAPDADLLEIESAAFELFEDEKGWGWRLIDDGGWQVAAGTERFDSRTAAREAMEFLVEHAESEIRRMETPIVQAYVDDDEWRWRYVDTDNAVLAETERADATRDELDERIDAIRSAADDAPIHVVEDAAIEIDPDDGWRWTFVDADREPLAVGTHEHEDRTGASAEVTLVRHHGTDASVFEIDGAALRVVGSDGGWRWQLIDGDRTIYATGPTAFDDRDAAVEAAREVRELAPHAGKIDLDAAGFELFEDGEGWRWRLLDSDETVMSVGSTTHDERASARDAVDEVRELVAGASVLEIDDPAFELHQGEDGWHWQLVDENGNALAEGLSSYETREGAREATSELKQYAPDSAVSVQA